MKFLNRPIGVWLLWSLVTLIFGLTFKAILIYVTEWAIPMSLQGNWAVGFYSLLPGLIVWLGFVSGCLLLFKKYVVIVFVWIAIALVAILSQHWLVSEDSLGGAWFLMFTAPALTILIGTLYYVSYLKSAGYFERTSSEPQ